LDFNFVVSIGERFGGEGVDACLEVGVEGLDEDFVDFVLRFLEGEFYVVLCHNNFGL